MLSLAIFTAPVIPITVILTWIYSSTCGGLLLVVLAHASINTFSICFGPHFPSEAGSPVNGLVGFDGAAVLVIVLTKGRLGYDRYLCEAPSDELTGRSGYVAFAIGRESPEGTELETMFCCCSVIHA